MLGKCFTPRWEKRYLRRAPRPTSLLEINRGLFRFLGPSSGSILNGKIRLYSCGGFSPEQEAGARIGTREKDEIGDLLAQLQGFRKFGQCK